MPWLECLNTVDKTSLNVGVHKVLTTLGRADGNDVVLQDAMVQPTHAHIMRQGDAYTVAQLGRAELYVNGKRCKKAELKAGDRLQIGAWELTWSETAPESNDSLAELPSPPFRPWWICRRR